MSNRDAADAPQQSAKKTAPAADFRDVVRKAQETAETLRKDRQPSREILQTPVTR